METISESHIEKYFDLLQGIINRIANNCSNCKSWCITIVSAIIVIAFDKSKPELIYVALLPTLIFWLLDSYYLSIEREFVKMHKALVKKFHSSTLSNNDLFVLTVNKGFLRRVGVTIKAAFDSASTFPFYLILSLLIFFASKFNN